MAVSYLLCFLLMIPLSSADTIYRSQDDKGVVFSDKPIDGSKVYSLGKSDRISVPKPVAVEPSSVLSSTPKASKEKAITILSPKQDGTVISMEGSIVFEIALSRPLNKKHFIELLIKGDEKWELKAISRQLEIVIKDLPRGTHRFKVRLINERQLVVAQSKEITVHLKRPFVRRHTR